MCNNPELWDDGILLNFAVKKGSCRGLATLKIIYNLILNTQGNYFSADTLIFKKNS